MNKKIATDKPSDYVVGTYYEPALQARLERRHAPYEFKFCQEGDWDKLRAFIRNFWGANHIYVTCPELLNWQQYNKVEGRYNFVFAEHRETGEVLPASASFSPRISILRSPFATCGSACGARGPMHRPALAGSLAGSLSIRFGREASAVSGCPSTPWR
jgi:hypothetical protein